MDTPEQINVVVIEDNKKYAKMLTYILDLSTQLTCRGVYYSSEAFLSELDTDGPGTDVILLDLHLPGRNGLSLISLLKQKLSNTEILILTQDDSYLKTLEAVRLGASGYILKDSSTEEIKKSIVEVNEGGCVIDPQLCKCVLEVMDAKTVAEHLISARERQILELLAAGFAKKEVAEHLEVMLSHGYPGNRADLQKTPSSKRRGSGSKGDTKRNHLAAI